MNNSNPYINSHYDINKKKKCSCEDKVGPKPFSNEENKTHTNKKNNS